MAELNAIMHVDDDEDILEISRLALQVVDRFELRQFACSSQALAAIEEVGPDLLLLDVMMPGMTGPELWAEVRQRPGFEKIPAVFMTAKAEEEIHAKLLSQGALDVVTKPFDPMTLGARLREAWARA